MMKNNSQVYIPFSLCFFVVACFGCGPDVPTTKCAGIIAFGGDIIDTGNNNHGASSWITSNYQPYGIDYPDGATGRFSNGKLVIDVIAEQLQLPSPPALAENKKYGKGVNLASSGAGIMDVTDVLLHGVKSLDRQVTNFINDVVPTMEKQLNCKSQFFLPNYLFVVGVGNNDYASYEILGQQILWKPKVFATLLVDKLFKRLQRLYHSGARKFVILSVYPIGCEPGLVRKKTDGCLDDVNEHIDLYYQALKAKVGEMSNTNNSTMPNAKFTIIDSGKIILDFIKNPSSSGFTNVNCPCCNVTSVDICQKGGKACLKRKEYVYFDGLHLTEAANVAFGTKAAKSINIC